MNKTKLNIIFWSKIIIFIYILISPFIYGKWIRYLNKIYIKIILLLLIVILTYIDFELSLLAMIAFLLFLINLNKLDIKNTENMVNSLSQKEQANKILALQQLQIEAQKKEISEKISNYNLDYNSKSSETINKKEEIYNFPDDNRKDETDEININEISEKINNYNLDYNSKSSETINKKEEIYDFPNEYCPEHNCRLNNINKSYADYINKLSPLSSINNIQTNILENFI